MLKTLFYRRVSPTSNNATSGDVVNYLEREAAEGSEAIESTNRPTSAASGGPQTPTNLNLDPRFLRSVSHPRSEDGQQRSKLGPSPVPLDQLLGQHDDSSSSIGGGMF
jgi:hypothetical protein